MEPVLGLSCELSDDQEVLIDQETIEDTQAEYQFCILGPQGMPGNRGHPDPFTYDHKRSNPSLGIYVGTAGNPVPQGSVGSLHTGGPTGTTGPRP